MHGFREWLITDKILIKMRNTQLITIAGYLLTLLALPAVAKDFEDGQKFFASKDYVRAVESLTKSAEQGNIKAQLQLGIRNFIGLSMPQNYQQAVFWYHKAAEQGSSSAQLQLGGMYDDGMGIEQDYQQALTWYLKAAEQGNAVAQIKLGNMYTNGNGVIQDYIEADKWFIIADASGHSGGNKNRKLVEKHMTPEQVNEAKKRAGDWTTEHKLP
jgi:uncharacterized protein